MDTSLQFNQPNELSFQELFDGLSPEGRYANLQLILSRYLDKKELPAYYLWVSRESFGKVRLNNVDFDGTHVHLDIQDCSTGIKKAVPIDIDDNTFQFLLLSWEDIRVLVLKENKSETNDELLDFEF